MGTKRGAFIVFEGLDRLGKTTQSRLLLDYLKNDKRLLCERLSFPKRDTKIGELIDLYLKNKIDYDDHSIHLLFSANRWECNRQIEEKLLNGTTLIVDRYVYSGIAFSHAKGTLDYNWCCSCDFGLIKPDLVLYMNKGNLAVKNSGTDGGERYETTEMQAKVEKCFEKFQNASYWTSINVSQQNGNFRSETDIQNDVQLKVSEIFEQIKDEKLNRLWKKDFECS
ncbi:unnamed protein product [Didymodactylos carnosus]|uniref:Thymidylate kinase n=1 Tax=Didymodactylos carnosus TaxID=1234261 RepID=A0A813RBU9_9BILA|nr:unnamed protein product [Didymodactylos carnosus]CAF0780340.1 unnamed protein product [Didymodactylos carnosus]CAF3493540.1 unnamed protein product [Didymodactylos carnosus]CAF3563447.1 unnamed protein product [Didymodactylos carnosus]